MADTHLQINADGSTVMRKTVLWPSSTNGREEVLKSLFSRNNWEISRIFNVSGSHWKVEVSCQDISYRINLYIGSVRDEARQEDEFKMQLGGTYPTSEEEGWITLILGIYAISNDTEEIVDYILSAYNNRNFDFSGNPSIRGTRTKGLQLARILGFYKTDKSYLFRPDFLYYYIQNQKTLEANHSVRNALTTQVQTQDNSSYLPYLTALRTKPFMLLAGISGTGKSRIVKELAFMTCPNEEGYNNDKTTPGNYSLIEVKPNWHDSSELLGYYNALDGKYELTPFIRFAYRALHRTDVPFFVCLDEMNLAPVEQYFAEYLSVLETRTKDGEKIISAKLIKKEAFNGIDVTQKYKDEDIAIAQYLQENGLPLPSNLYIIGTVNMDDTTHQFSRKVIDRAFTIEMNGGKLEDMFKPENSNALQYRDEVVSQDRFKSHFVNATEVFKDGESDTLWTQYETKIKNDVPARLKAINDILKNTPFQVSYRVQNELILYLAYLIEEAGFPEDIEPYIGEATLAILMEKILPRIQGDDKLLGRGQNKDVFTELSEYVEQTLMTRKTTDEQTKLVEGSDLYRKVIDKLDQMHKRLENSYFANFF